MGRQPRAPRGRTGPWLRGEEEEEETGILPAPAAFPGLTQPAGKWPDFKCGGAAAGLMFRKAWPAAGGRQGLDGAVSEGLKNRGGGFAVEQSSPLPRCFEPSRLVRTRWVSVELTLELGRRRGKGGLSKDPA